MVPLVIGLIPDGGPIELFLIPASAPSLINHINKSHGMCYPVWDSAYKSYLTANQKE